MKSKKRHALSSRLYCIIDGDMFDKKNHLKVAKSLLKDGVRLLQLRFKNAPSYKVVDIAGKISALASKYKAKVFINDRIDLALTSDASGVHLGLGDMKISNARSFLGPRLFVGATVHSAKEAMALKNEHVDYVGAGPVFATPIKKHLKQKGPAFIKIIKKYISVPVFAIGGINKVNTGCVLAAGADGVCVRRATTQAKQILKTL